MMSHNNKKLRRGGEDDRTNKERAGGKKRSRWSKQHLYLVLDDWDKGFSIHKIDADSFDDDDYSSSGSDDDHHHHHKQQYHRLPEAPPVLRFETPAVNDHLYVAGSGAKMFAVMNNRCGLVYDADAAVLAVGTHAPPQMVFGFGVCMAVGDVFYVLSYRSLTTNQGPNSFEAMSWSPSPAAAGGTGVGGGGWAWKTLPAPPPTLFTADQIVVAHALHPDGCTIFMTTANRGFPNAPVGTYSFNTTEATWRWHGERACLPFKGQGHFDTELGAWVGLGLDGHICSCQVISPDLVSAQPPPNKPRWDVCVDPKVYLEHQSTEEKLFRSKEFILSASLSCLGTGTGRFCLVECVPSGVMQRRVFGDDDGCVLNVTVFGLKYNHKGELQTTDHRSTRSFLVSRHRSRFVPFTLWT